MATILVVDDEPALLATLVRMLQAAELGEVLASHTGEHARAVLAERTVDVLVTDLLMPGVTGYDLIDELAEKAVRIVVLSAVASSLVSARARARVDAVLEKPVSPRVLVEAVRKALLPRPA